MNILLIGMICYFFLAFMFLIYSFILLLEWNPFKIKWKKNVIYPFRKFLIRHRKLSFIPNDSLFFDILKLQHNVEYHVAVQTTDKKWYYNGILWMSYDGQLLIRVCDNNQIKFPKLDTIKYISFHSHKLYKDAKKALEINLIK